MNSVDFVDESFKGITLAVLSISLISNLFIDILRLSEDIPAPLTLCLNIGWLFVFFVVVLLYE